MARQTARLRPGATRTIEDTSRRRQLGEELEKNLVLRARQAVEVLEQSVVLGSEGIVFLDPVDESHRVTLHRRE